MFDDENAGGRFLRLKVRSTTEIDGSAAQRIIVTSFDPKQPMSADYLPPNVADDDRFVWIFAGAAQAAQAAHGPS